MPSESQHAHAVMATKKMPEHFTAPIPNKQDGSKIRLAHAK
jgi:hypothetical protein